MHHVVGVASKVSPNGKIPDEGRRTRLMVWGKGNQGQLGNEGHKDCNSPQVGRLWFQLVAAGAGQLVCFSWPASWLLLSNIGNRAVDSMSFEPMCSCHSFLGTHASHPPHTRPLHAACPGH